MVQEKPRPGLLKLRVLSFLLTFLLGIVFWGGFNWSMELTNTEEFCVSCHVMRDNVYQEYTKSVHHSNRTGVRATCPDCHVPKEWIHKVARKISATNELYHWAIGTIDSREKFINKRYELANHVWDAMKETDSRECRNCHENVAMLGPKQSPKAEKLHELSKAWDMTCIQCHQGIAHNLPAEFDKELVIDSWHTLIEQQKIDCIECHEEMPAVLDNGDW